MDDIGYIGLHGCARLASQIAVCQNFTARTSYPCLSLANFWCLLKSYFYFVFILCIVLGVRQYGYINTYSNIPNVRMYVLSCYYR